MKFLKRIEKAFSIFFTFIWFFKKNYFYISTDNLSSFLEAPQDKFLHNILHRIETMGLAV